MSIQWLPRVAACLVFGMFANPVWSQGGDPEPPVAAAPSAPVAAANVGHRESVSPELFTGALSALIPLPLALEDRGLLPPLAFHYNSRSGNGWVGVGWDLSLPSIARDTSSRVNYAAETYVYRFAGNQIELIKVAENDYRAKLEGMFLKFTRIVAADGRHSWRMQNGRGTVFDFGTTDETTTHNPANPNQIFAWHLEAIRDLRKHEVTMTYERVGALLYPKVIEYGPIGSRRALAFETEPRADHEEGFRLGFRTSLPRRLKTIVLKLNGVVQGAVTVDYDAVPAGAESITPSRLAFLTRQSPAGAGLRIVSLDYSPTVYGLGATATWQGPQLDEYGLNRDCLSGDFTGDGKTDFACSAGGSNWNVSVAAKGTWLTTQWPAGVQPRRSVAEDCFSVDLNGDVRADITCYQHTGDKWSVALSTGTGWMPVQTWSGGPSPMDRRNCTLGDFTGDGRADILCQDLELSGTGAGSTDWRLSEAREGSFQQRTVLKEGALWPRPHGGTIPHSCVTGDFDGDLRNDIACRAKENQKEDLWNIALARDGAWETKLHVQAVTGSSPVSKRCVAADVNGDAFSDLLCAQGTEGEWQVALNTSSGAFEIQTWKDGAKVDGNLHDRCMIGDINADGRVDIACLANNGKDWSVALSTGRDWVRSAWQSPTSFPLPLGRHCVFGDLLGAGQLGGSCKSGGTSWLFAGAPTTTPNLITRARGAFGGQSLITYGSSSDSMDPRLPALHVVQRVENYDGVAVREVSTVSYKHGRYSPKLRDFRGFGEVSLSRQASHRVAGVTTTYRFHQGDRAGWTPDSADDPVGVLSGKMAQVETSTSEAVLLSRVEHDYYDDATAPYFNPIKEIRQFSCRGPCLAPNRSTFVYDEFGNRTEHALFSRDDAATPVTVVRTEFINDAAAWRFGKPRTTTTTSGATGTVLHESHFFYDASTDCDASDVGDNQTIAVGELTGLRRRLNETEWQTTVFRYDSDGNLACTKNSRNARTTYLYDATGEFLLSAKNARGHEVLYRYFGVDGEPSRVGLFGLLRRVIDPNRNVTLYDYDELGRLVREVIPDRDEIRHVYASIGMPGSQAIERHQGTTVLTTTYLDGFGRPVRTRQAWSNGTQIEQTTKYGPGGLIVERTVPRFSDAAEFTLATLNYDALGRLRTEERADGATVTHCHFPDYKLSIDGNGHAQLSVVDYAGNTVEMWSLSGTFDRDCDAAQNARDAIKASGRLYALTRFEYDELSRPRKLRDAGENVIEKQYDVGGRLISHKDPNRALLTFTYDTESNLLKRTDAAARETSYHYDSLNRVERIDHPASDALAPTIFNYDSGAATADNLIGRLARSSTADGTKAYIYDKTGAVTTVTTKIGARTFRVHRRYDALGRLDAVTYPDGAVVDYEFAGPFLSVVRHNGSELIRYKRQSAIGYPREVAFANGVTTTYTYSEAANPDCPAPTLRLCSIKTAAGGGSQREYRFTYDAAGNLATVRDDVRDVVQRFYLDAFDRLYAVAEQGIPGSSWPLVPIETADPQAAPAEGGAASWLPSTPGLRWVAAYTYNTIGNMTWSHDRGLFIYPASGPYSVRPHTAERVGSTVYDFDDVGVLSMEGARTFSHDADGRARSASVAGRTLKLGYAGDGSMVTIQDNATTRIGIDRIYACIASECWKTIYVGEQPIAIVKGTQRYYLHANHLGSIELVTDRAGAVKGNFRYGPFGELIQSTAGLPVPVPTFLGREALLDPAIIHLGLRHYDTRTKRFLSPDSVTGNGSPYAASPYAYAFHNPQTYADSTGDLAWFVPILIGAAIGGIQAERHGGNFWEGALRGAVAGAFVSLGGYLAGAKGVSTAGQYFVQGWAGAASGAVQYELWGGDGQSVNGKAVFPTSGNSDFPTRLRCVVVG